MILRKPYKFLIKHFKMIHFILFLPVVYLIIKTNAIVKFFGNYVNNSFNYSYIGNLAGNYINLFMYLAIIIIILGAITIYYLMKQKEKSTKLYIGMIVYYILLFIMLTITHNILSDIERKELTAQASRAYRDISIIVVAPGYFFAFYTIFRGLGFDIKSFKFEIDLKDLDINEEDNEEFEFVLGVETYKYKRTFRRFIREFRYYILENKFIFICLSVIASFIVITILYMHFGVYNKTYSKDKTFSHSAFTLTMQDSYLTNMDYNGNQMGKDKYYLVLKINVANNSNRKEILDTTNFRLQVKDGYVVPTLDRSEYFVDIAAPYYGEKLKPNTDNTYNLVYELTKEQLKNSYDLKILESIEYGVGSLTPHYKILEIKPKTAYDVSLIKELKINEEFKLSDSNLLETTIKVKSYEIVDNYTYTYEYCSTNSCRTLSDIISAGYGTTSLKSTLLVLDINADLDKNTIYYKTIKTKNKFYEDFFTVEDSYRRYDTKNITPKNMTDRIVLQVDSRVKDSTNLKLNITIRDKRYNVILKGA